MNKNVDIIIKFKRLFSRIFEENYVITRYYSERLLKCLDYRSDKDGVHPIDTPIFTDIIIHAFQNLQKMSIPNRIFILEIVTIMFRNEMQFNKFQSQGFDLQILRSFGVDSVETERPSPELQLTCIKMATSLVSHCSGMKMITINKSWEKALQPGLHLRPHVGRAVYEFLSKLIWKFDEYEDETSLYEILRAILKPIHMSEYQTLEIFDVEKEESYSGSVIAPLHALLTIMSETARLTNSKCFVPILKQCYFVEAPMRKLRFGTRDPNIINLLNQLNFHFYIAIFSKASIKTGRSESDFLNEIIALFVNCITILLHKEQMITPLLEFVLAINLTWAKSLSRLYSSTFQRNGLKYEMEDQFLWPLMLPMMTYILNNSKIMPEKIEEYSAKMGQLITEHVTKVGYRYKAKLEREDQKKITIQNMKLLFKLKGHLKAKQAGLLFQSLFHLLRTFIAEGEGDESVPLTLNGHPLQTSDDVKLLSLTLAAIKMLLTEHTIYWHESLEIIYLQNTMTMLLKQEAMPIKQIIQILDLLELAIRQFLSPDMALLVESKHSTALSELASIMERLIRHEQWEVRDSALTLLLVCTDISFVKYMPLQKLISEKRLMILASQAALSDPEYYVQTSALKCLAAATKIESIWREVLNNNPNLYTKLTYILRHNPEGIVRTEAVKVLTEAYVNQITTKDFQKRMYNVMTSAALDDLHWEVQIAALQFWKPVIKNNLSDRGMMDGKFPKITFSKEKRKIVVLDEKEIKRQLSALMNELSDNRCLTVLNGCMNEDFNIEVMKLAHCMASKLVAILDRYYFDKEIDDIQLMEYDSERVELHKNKAMDLIAIPNNAERDSIIEEIVNAETSDLIMNLHHEMGMNSDEMENGDFILVPLKEAIHPNKFLEDFKRTDHLTLIDNIMNWKLEPPTLSALLDEVLGDTDMEMYDYCIE